MDYYDQNVDCCENYYSHSHAGYETLEGDIIRRLEEINKLPEDERSYELSNLPQEIYDSNGGQYDMTIIEKLIEDNLMTVRNVDCNEGCYDCEIYDGCETTPTRMFLPIEDDIINRINEIKSLPVGEQEEMLSNLAHEMYCQLYEQYGEQFDFETIQGMIKQRFDED